MKRFALLAFSALVAFLFAGVSYAQTEYAPLIQKDTVSLARVDLTKLTSDDLSQKVLTIANGAIDYFVQDSETASEAKKAVPLASLFIAQYFGTCVQPLKDAGVERFYVVVDQGDDPAEMIYPYIAIPTAKMSDKQVSQARQALADLNQTLNSAIKYRFARNGFLFVLLIPENVDSDEAKAYVKKRFTKMEAVEKPEFEEGFKNADPGAFVCGVSLAVDNTALAASKVQEAIDSVEGEEAATAVKALQGSVEKLLESSKEMISLVKSNVWSVNLDKLEIVSAIQANSEDDAQKYAEKLENTMKPAILGIFDQIFAEAANQDQLPIEKDDLDKINSTLQKVVGLFMEMKVDGSSLVWKMNEAFWTDNRSTFDEVVKLVAELQAKYAANEDEESDDSELEFEEL